MFDCVCGQAKQIVSLKNLYKRPRLSQLRTVWYRLNWLLFYFYFYTTEPPILMDVVRLKNDYSRNAIWSNRSLVYWYRSVRSQLITWLTRIILQTVNTMGRGGSQVVSVLTFYSDDPSSNPPEAYSFFCKICTWKTENKNKKAAGVDPLKIRLLNTKSKLKMIPNRTRPPVLIHYQVY